MFPKVSNSPSSLLSNLIRATYRRVKRRKVKYVKLFILDGCSTMVLYVVGWQTVVISICWSAERTATRSLPPQKDGIELSPQQLRSKVGPRKFLLLHNDRDDKIDLRHSLTFRYQGNLRFYHLPADKSLLMCLSVKCRARCDHHMAF